MAKIVKYCSSCEEGFAEKFGFCPNCGSHLTAFEMNPLENKSAEEIKTAPANTVETFVPPVIAAVEPKVPQVAEFQAIPAETKTVAPIAEDVAPISAVESTATANFSGDDFEEQVPATKSFEQPIAETFNEVKSDDLYAATYAKTADEAVKSDAPYYVPSGGFSPTIVEERNVKQRNSLLLGAFSLMLIVLLGSYVYSMFNKYLDIAAIETPNLVSYVGDITPAPIEVEPPPMKEKKDAGGGGGGGKEEETAATKGRTATQVDDPLFAPSSKMDRVTDPDIAIRAATKGNKQAPQTDENYGAVQGLSGRSDGTGTGGGIGSGRGRGQGSGNGEGLGSGTGSGSGGGIGPGNGDGTGPGDEGDGPKVKKPTPVPVPAGPTIGVTILSKPRANYTDAARQAQVQGKVVLRVTFSANGSVGAIAVISGLGNGLTEQAIAAAKGIRFEPAKRGGVAYSVTKPVEYSFTIY